jgi:transcriptional regulator with XRE-family HTH domain
MPSQKASEDGTSHRLAPALPLRLVRLARGYSQTHLAERAGVDTSTISRLENGHQRAYRGTQQRLATALRWDSEDLFPNDDDRPGKAVEVTTTGGRARNVSRTP